MYQSTSYTVSYFTKRRNETAHWVFLPAARAFGILLFFPFAPCITLHLHLPLLSAVPASCLTVIPSVISRRFASIRTQDSQLLLARRLRLSLLSSSFLRPLDMSSFLFLFVSVSLLVSSLILYVFTRRLKARTPTSSTDSINTIYSLPLGHLSCPHLPTITFYTSTSIPC